MKNVTIPALLALAVLGGGWTLWQRSAEQTDAGGMPAGPGMVAVTLPQRLSDKAERGADVFAENCAACHGANAAGRDGSGPPLVHKIYEPSHHGDMAFFLAVENGVRAHHWRFGNMAPVEGVDRAEIGELVAYVRELQQANGIN